VGGLWGLWAVVGLAVGACRLGLVAAAVAAVVARGLVAAYLRIELSERGTQEVEARGAGEGN